jgi:hypothetical protein
MQFIDPNPTLVANLVAICLRRTGLRARCPRRRWRLNSVLRAQNSRELTHLWKQCDPTVQPHARRRNLRSILQHLLAERRRSHGHDDSRRSGLREHLIHTGLPTALLLHLQPPPTTPTSNDPGPYIEQRPPAHPSPHEPLALQGLQGQGAHQPRNLQRHPRSQLPPELRRTAQSPGGARFLGLTVRLQ